MSGFGYTVLGFGSHPSRGPAALSISLDATEGNLIGDISRMDPAAGAQTVDTDPGAVDVTATAAGGDNSSYAYAWTVSELADPQNEWAVLAAGTQNVAQYNDATWRLTAFANGPESPPEQSVYRLRCTVTDGASDTAIVDYTLTGIGQ